MNDKFDEPSSEPFAAARTRLVGRRCQAQFSLAHHGPGGWSARAGLMRSTNRRTTIGKEFHHETT